jgi:hypothetical protein
MKMEEKKKRYALPIPRAITTGIVFEAAEKFGLEVDQEKPPEDASRKIAGGKRIHIQEARELDSEFRSEA